MDQKEFEQYLLNICPWVSQDTFDKFTTYKQTLQHYNQQMNLSRLVSDDKIYDQYFLASLLPFTKLDYFSSDINLSLLDIGTGSGIPGIVLKIIYPHLNVTLVEASAKKCKFLKIILDLLHLDDVTLVNQRCEEYIKNHRESFDLVTSRAVSSLNKILELSAPFAKVDGHIIALKSQNYLMELSESQNAIQILDLSLSTTINYNFANHTHVVLDFQKKQITNKIYPRNWQKIVSKPL